MLRLVDLANRPDFDIGPMRVSPARRLLEGPGSSATVEPIVMKVLLVLLDARGNVVTREALFASAWGGVFVGDDSLNRAIARVRKAAAEVAPGTFEMETIPRTGYRLTGEGLDPADGTGDALAADFRASISRRVMIGSTAGVALAGTAGLGLWSMHSKDRRFDDLVMRGEDALEYGDGSAAQSDYLRQAVAIRPNDGAAQGLLAFALMDHADDVNKAASTSRVDEAQKAASTSLRLQPNNAAARLAMIQLQRSTLDLAETEDRLRGVLSSAPDNIFAMRLLWDLQQSAGRSREALALVERAIKIKSLAAANNFPLAQLLWIVGRTAEADPIIDRAMQFWPAHRYVRFARFSIFAFTGRPRAALAMLDNDAVRPQSFSPASVALWRTLLLALDQPSHATIAQAKAASFAAVKREPKLASQAMITLSSLGEIDAAFEIANELLVFRGPDKSAQDPTSDSHPKSTGWRFMPWLFIPPGAAMRADPRFAALADGIGLTAYWAKRHIKPDYQMFG